MEVTGEMEVDIAGWLHNGLAAASTAAFAAE
jgi:hypothetical protein